MCVHAREQQFITKYLFSLKPKVKVCHVLYHHLSTQIFFVFLPESF